MAIFVFVSLVSCTTPGPAPEVPSPPPVPREFRAAWVANVANIDWPSKKGLPVAEQQREIVAIVERAAALGLNALVVQVRPSADAIYPSAYEPWTEYLTGETGKPPEPFYDPLAMWVAEAHKRGIELHAWFNPYRARHTAARSAPSKNHIANTWPQAVREYGGFLWMDPGDEFAAQRTLDVILDVVKRYDVDGVHIDDYFYPYPVNAPGAPGTGSDKGPEIDFPDDAPWSAYLLAGGKLARADWRRQNVDRLIERIHQGVHAEKPWVRFGISPFGLPRPDRRPPGIAGFSQYDKLYADVEKWLEQGWLDYFVPQLYWPIDQAAQSYPVLLDYWLAGNAKGRHVWPGLYTSRIDSSAKSWKPEEVLKQVAIARERGAANPLARGHVHFSMVALMENRQGIADQLAAAYATPALVPAAPWLGNEKLPAPRAALARTPERLVFTLSPQAGMASTRFGIWALQAAGWTFSTPHAATFSFPLGDAPRALVVVPIDRFGNEGDRLVLSGADLEAAR